MDRYITRQIDRYIDIQIDKQKEGYIARYIDKFD